MNDLEKKSIECLKNMSIEETTYQVARNVVLDYINNLQQENERLKTKTKEQSLLLIDYQDMEQKLEDYKSRIEKMNYDIEVLRDHIRCLLRVEDLYNHSLKEYNKLQRRIEKAVEYINYCDDLSVVNDYSITEKPIIEKIAKKDLLDILNGRSDK